MKKLLASLIVVAALPLIGRADTVTPRLSLTEPDVNSANWGTKLNNNFGLIDTGAGVLAKSNTWAQTNTFQGPVIISSYTTITSSVAFSTITVQSLTAAALTATSPATFKSSATINGNAEVDGVFIATGAVTLGSAGNAVTISSNTIMPGATFYQGANIILGSGNSVTISSNAVMAGTTIYQGTPLYHVVTDTASIIQLWTPGILVSSNTFTITTASTTSQASSWAKSSLCTSITPRQTTDTIEIVVDANITFATANNCYVSVTRGNTELSASTFGFNSVTNMSNIPVSFVVNDSPGTTSATTYCVAMKPGTAVACTLDNQGTDNTIILRDWSRSYK